MSEMPIVRIQRAAIRNFRNVESGEFVSPAIMVKIFLRPKQMFLEFMVRMDRVRLRLLMRWRF